MNPRAPTFRAACVVAAFIAMATLGACDPRPSTPPAPKASANEGPTAAGGGPPSASYPGGIKPAPSGNLVATSNPANKGPSEGGSAVGGMSAGQGGGAAAAGGTPAPTPGDGATPVPTPPK